MGLDPEQVAAFVQRSCESQGVPVKISDRLVVEQVAALLRTGTSSSNAA